MKLCYFTEMKEVLKLFLVIAFAVNSYASPLIFIVTKEVNCWKYKRLEFYTELKKLKLSQITVDKIGSCFKRSKKFVSNQKFIFPPINVIKV